MCRMDFLKDCVTCFRWSQVLWCCSIQRRCVQTRQFFVQAPTFVDGHGAAGTRWRRPLGFPICVPLWEGSILSLDCSPEAASAYPWHSFKVCLAEKHQTLKNTVKSRSISKKNNGACDHARPLQLSRRQRERAPPSSYHLKLFFKFASVTSA